MFRAINSLTGKTVFASRSLRLTESSDIVYLCPCCKDKVQLVTGDPTKRSAFFRHYPNKACDYQQYKDSANNKSGWHKHWQTRFSSECREVYISSGERHYIADVVLNDNLIVEFQHGEIKPENFYKRSVFYLKCGYMLVWLFEYSFKYSDILKQIRDNNPGKTIKVFDSIQMISEQEREKAYCFSYSKAIYPQLSEDDFIKMLYHFNEYIAKQKDEKRKYIAKEKAVKKSKAIKKSDRK